MRAGREVGYRRRLKAITARYSASLLPGALFELLLTAGNHPVLRCHPGHPKPLRQRAVGRMSTGPSSFPAPGRLRRRRTSFMCAAAQRRHFRRSTSQICARPRRPAPPIKDRRRGPSATSNRTLLRECTARTRGWRARTPSTSLLQQPGAASPLAAASAGCAAPSASLLRSCFLMCNGLQSTQRSAEPGFAHVFSSV